MTGRLSFVLKMNEPWFVERNTFVLNKSNKSVSINVAFGYLEGSTWFTATFDLKRDTQQQDLNAFAEDKAVAGQMIALIYLLYLGHVQVSFMCSGTGPGVGLFVQF